MLATIYIIYGRSRIFSEIDAIPFFSDVSVFYLHESMFK